MYVHRKEMYIHESKCVFIKKKMYLLPESSRCVLVL